MTKSFFVTGTDTGVGKTLIASALLHAANQKHLRTLGLKPVAAGCEQTGDGLRNDDALQLMQAASVKLSYDQVNPVALQAAIAPHVAAANEGRRLSVDRLVGFCRGALMNKVDFCLIEGAGGWRVPLNPRETMADLARALDIPVLLVVGIRLGCINHALLTAEAIARDGLKIAGWVASCVEPEQAARQENVDTLRALLPFPLLGVVPFLDSPSLQTVSSHLDISKLTG